MVCAPWMNHLRNRPRRLRRSARICELWLPEQIRDGFREHAGDCREHAGDCREHAGDCCEHSGDLSLARWGLSLLHNGVAGHPRSCR